MKNTVRVDCHTIRGLANEPCAPRAWQDRWLRPRAIYSTHQAAGGCVLPIGTQSTTCTKTLSIYFTNRPFLGYSSGQNIAKHLTFKSKQSQMKNNAWKLCISRQFNQRIQHMSAKAAGTPANIWVNLFKMAEVFNEATSNVDSSIKNQAGSMWLWIDICILFSIITCKCLVKVYTLSQHNIYFHTPNDMFSCLKF